MEKEIELRKVEQQDCEILFDWVNEPAVRKNAFESKYICWEEHKNWFTKKLSSDQAQIYIAKDNNQPVGQIRFEKENNKAVVDVSIGSQFREKGYGVKVIACGSDKFLSENEDIEILEAQIKKTNKASIEAFRKAGYIFEHKDEINNCPTHVYVLKNANKSQKKRE